MQALDRFERVAGATAHRGPPALHRPRGQAIDTPDVALRSDRVPAQRQKRLPPGKARAIVIGRGEAVVSIGAQRFTARAPDVLFVPAGVAFTIHPSGSGVDFSEVTPKRGVRLPAPAHLPFDPAKVFAFEEGCAIHESFNRPNVPGLSLSLAFTPNDTLTAEHALRSTEFQLVLSGEAEFQIEGQRFCARPGDIVEIPKDRFQRVRGLSDEPFTVMCVCLPRFELSRYRERAGVGQATPK